MSTKTDIEMTNRSQAPCPSCQWATEEFKPTARAPFHTYTGTCEFRPCDLCGSDKHVTPTTQGARCVENQDGGPL